MYMSVVKPSFRIIIAALVTAILVGCSSPGNDSQNNHNKAAASPTVPVISSITNANKASPAAAPARSPAGGVIVVTSTPPDAIVVLVREEEGSSGNPERKGATPVTISGVAPGKYSITLEKTGYRYFQKEVEVKENKTVKIAANLKRG
jgi:hypothetical protein